MARASLDQAYRHWQSWLEAWRDGRVDPGQFAAAVREVRAQDQWGRWWQPAADGTGWLWWDGTTWQLAACPPGYEAAAAAAPVAADRRDLAGPGGEAFMEPTRFLDTARSVPLRQRPQSWWNLLAVLGGAVSGYLWFVCGSVRGMPRLNLLGLGRESWLDLLPTMALLALPVGLVLIRQVVARVAGGVLRSHWAVKVVLAVVGLGAGALLMTNNRVFTQREGLDLVTPLLMTGIPFLLVWFRRPVDRLLEPLQVVRQHVPRLVLVGMGLATPFVVAFLLYYVVGLSMYPLLRANVVVGVLASYVILRTPQPSGRAGVAVAAASRVLGVLAVLALLADPAWADDFLRDPFNLNDGLRTNVIAPVLSGLATAVVTVLVNGVEVAQVMLQGPAPEGQDGARVDYSVVIRTVNGQGAQTTVLDAADGGAVFVYAHCEKAGSGRFPAGDATIRFALADASGWVGLADLGSQHGERCARASLASEPPGGTAPPASVVVTVSAGAGGLVGVPVTLTVRAGGSLMVETESHPP